MGKKPLNEKQVKTLRKLVADKPLHSLLLNLGCDLMLRSSDLLKLKVSDVMNESGTPKTEVKVKQKMQEERYAVAHARQIHHTIKILLDRRSQKDFLLKGHILELMKHLTSSMENNVNYTKNFLSLKNCRIPF